MEYAPNFNFENNRGMNIIKNKKFFDSRESTTFYRVELTGTSTTKTYIIPESWLKSNQTPPSSKNH